MYVCMYVCMYVNMHTCIEYAAKNKKTSIFMREFPDDNKQEMLNKKKNYKTGNQKRQPFSPEETTIAIRDNQKISASGYHFYN